MPRKYFEEYTDNYTLIRGYIDSENRIGYAEVYKSMEQIHIDIRSKSSIPKDPYTDKQYALKLASEALEKG